MPNNSSVTQTYNSFSGVDMIVTFGSTTVGEVQGVSYTVTREKAPLYTMGSANPRSFSRGKRGIAGSLIFLVFDRSALLSIAGSEKSTDALYLKEHDFSRHNQTPNSLNGSAAPQPVSALSSTAQSAQAVNPSSTNANDVRGLLGVSPAKSEYHDQLPPFDITISAANEYGHVCRMMVRNVEIMNAGSGMSIDDITTDESCTFVATQIVPWHAQSTMNTQGFSTKTPSSSGSISP